MKYAGICACVLVWGGVAMTVGAEATAKGPYNLEGRIETVERIASHVEHGAHYFMGTRAFQRHWRVTLSPVVLEPPSAYDSSGAARMVNRRSPEYYGEREEMTVLLAPTIHERYLRKGVSLRLTFYREEGDERANRVSYQDAQVVAADQTKESLGGGSFVEHELPAEEQRLEGGAAGDRSSALLKVSRPLGGLVILLLLAVAGFLFFKHLQPKPRGAGSDSSLDPDDS